uniref:Uncharacterized protein n=1 Tax=Lepeophtheirus salmonis TaxID=72036 RepID=A0A0K2T1Q3_LEPSM
MMRLLLYKLENHLTQRSLVALKRTYFVLKYIEDIFMRNGRKSQLNLRNHRGYVPAS